MKPSLGLSVSVKDSVSVYSSGGCEWLSVCLVVLVSSCGPLVSSLALLWIFEVPVIVRSICLLGQTLAVWIN